MNSVLGPLIGKCVLVHMDDIGLSKVVGRKSMVSTYARQLLREHELSCKLKTCSFFQPHVAFLGHVISASGVPSDPAKVQAVVTSPNPSSVHNFHCFLGLTNCFRNFIQDYAKFARCLWLCSKRTQCGPGLTSSTRPLHVWRRHWHGAWARPADSGLHPTI